MKKIILLLVIFSMSIFSENLDQMPAKKALDKFIEVMKSGNFEKYSNDKQANAMFNISGMSKDEIKEMNKYKKIIGNNYKYKVTDVKETENNSEITMDVEYETVDYKGEQFQNIMRESNLKEEPLNEKTVDKIMGKYTDFIIVKKTIKVNMTKENNYWLLDLNENEDFMISLYLRGELYFFHI